jgi:CheY-like chemotaxis protein
MRRVLIVDDDPLFAETYQDELTGRGYEVALADGPAQLAAQLDGEPAHVVLMDIRLRGPGHGGLRGPGHGGLRGPGHGDVTGLDLIGDVLTRWPWTRVLVISGFLTADAVRRAFAAGATDLLHKDLVFDAMLVHKVQRAADAAERDMVADPAARERALRAAWAEAQREHDRYRKGVALERTLHLLLGSLRGLSGFQRMSSHTEELDIVVANASPDPFLQQQGAIWIVECKNWSTTVGVDAVHPLVHKMQHRYGRCRLGLLVSMNGFAATVADELRMNTRSEQLVVLLDGRDVEAWIAAADREAWLRDHIVSASTR